MNLSCLQCAKFAPDFSDSHFPVKLFSVAVLSARGITDGKTPVRDEGPVTKSS
jgi:hypothetical protein